MQISGAYRSIITIFLLIISYQPLHAATIFGTVTGPDGPMVGAKVVAEPDGQTPVETTTDEGGSYSFIVPDGHYYQIHAESLVNPSGFYSEFIRDFDVEETKEIRLFIGSRITINGEIDLPPDFDGPAQIYAQRLDKYVPSQEWSIDEDLQFQISGAAGVYAISVFPECPFKDALNLPVCPAKYFSSIAIDAREGSVNGVVVPVADPAAPLVPQTPPDASLITVGPAVDGIAMVTGAPGTVSGPARIGLVNLQTGHWTRGASGSDGSFQIPLLVPPGSYLRITQDPTSITFEAHTMATGTVIRVPFPEDPQNAYAALYPADKFQRASPVEQPQSLGFIDPGQVWISGTQVDRNWLAGEAIQLEGSIMVFSRNSAEINLGELNMHGFIYLERVFDAEGKQELPNPHFASHNLTPTGLPIGRLRQHSGGSAPWDAVEIGHFDSNEPGIAGPNSFEGTWQTRVNIPADLPDGIYSVVFEPVVQDIQSSALHFEDVYLQSGVAVFSKGGVFLVRIGSPSSSRLSWTLGMNDFSNGSRGTVALEDRDSVAIAGSITTNTHAFIIPREDSRTGIPRKYRLEPWLALSGASNQWITPPTVPFKFPSGLLTVRIEHPDGSETNLGSAPFRQPYVQGAISLSGNHFSPGSAEPEMYLGLSTANPNFQVSFEQYGLHRITMEGNIEDIRGTSYAGGGTYEVYIARHLDLETGVFPNTPFEIGDPFSPTIIVQPGVAADIEIRIDHFPQSDPDQLVSQTISGKANRFGYFQPKAGEAFVFNLPGEYRVYITASYRDEEEVLWMGAETWGSVVETPNSPLITHGLRNGDDQGGHQQWLLASETNIAGRHLPFPYHTGDIVWMMDTNFDEFSTAIFPAITIQDTQGDFSELMRERWPDEFYDIEELISLGQIRVFSSTVDGGPPDFKPDAPDTHKGYSYFGAARPGVRIRDLTHDGENGDTYWRFDDVYNYQPGNGSNGDLPNDFKFQFGGAVYRAPDLDFYYYGAYGSMWVMLPHDDATGTRVMPPFQGNGGGSSGGPIITLKGEEIDMFFHPMGVRPGSILEAGDVAAFSGQVAPTLPALVWMRITSPSGELYYVTNFANKVGYFYDPLDNFIVDEPGVWSVKVVTPFEGQTSAGQVTEPFPTGDILGSTNGTFHFYVVDKVSPPLEVDIPGYSWVEPGNGPIDIPVLPTDELSEVSVHRTTVMPGFLLEEADTSSTTYTYDAPTLSQDFPNIDLIDQDSRTGVDTITMSFLVSGVDGGGNTVHRARQVLLQGEELMAPAQESAFHINSGLNDAWVHAGSANQGMFVTVFPSFDLMFAAWFTFDSVAPPGDATAVVGAPDQRWVTALGPYSGTSAVLKAELTTGGSFNTSDPVPTQDTNYGTINMVFTGCNSANVDYDFPGPGETGSFVMNRVLPDNVGVCEGIVSGEIQPTMSTAEQAQRLSSIIKGTKPEAKSATFMINSGLNDAWVNANANFQGMFLTVFPELELMFAAWFTFDPEAPPADAMATFGAPDQRWLTALGSYSGTTANLNIENTTGGLFNSTTPTPTQDTGYGTMDIDFTDCNNATVTYNIPAATQSGTFNMTRVLDDNVGLCTVLSD